MKSVFLHQGYPKIILFFSASTMYIDNVFTFCTSRRAVDMGDRGQNLFYFVVNC